MQRGLWHVYKFKLVTFLGFWASYKLLYPLMFAHCTPGGPTHTDTDCSGAGARAESTRRRGQNQIPLALVNIRDNCLKSNGRQASFTQPPVLNLHSGWVGKYLQFTTNNYFNHPHTVINLTETLSLVRNALSFWVDHAIQLIVWKLFMKDELAQN